MRARPAPREFDPREIRNMAMWLRPETLVGRQAQGVSLWLDSSGRDRRGSQATASAQPPITLIRLARSRARGMGIQFDGTSDALDLANNLDLDAFTMFAVVNKSPGATGGYRAVLSSNKWNLYVNMNSNRWGLYGTNGVDSGQAVRDSTEAAPSAPSILTAMNDGVNTTLFTNGGAKVGPTGHTSTASRGDRVGSDASGVQFFEGALYEMIVYERAIKPFEQRPIEEYLYRRHVESPAYLLNAWPA